MAIIIDTYKYVVRYVPTFLLLTIFLSKNYTRIMICPPPPNQIHGATPVLYTLMQRSTYAHPDV